MQSPLLYRGNPKKKSRKVFESQKELYKFVYDLIFTNVLNLNYDTMDRRDFLRYSLLGGVGALTAGGTLIDQAFASQMPDKTVGLQLYSLRAAMSKSPLKTLKKVSAMGYKTLETASYDDGKIYGYTPEELSEIAADLGMTVSSAHVSLALPTDGFDEAMVWWDKCLDTQAAAGCNYVIFPWTPPIESLDQLNSYCDYFNKVGELAKTKGLRFGFHNHAGEFKSIDGNVILDYMIANTDPTNVLFELDVYWAQRGGVSPVEYIEKYMGRIPVLHIKDETTIGGSGTIDFQSIFEAAYRSGMESYYVEVERYDTTPEKDVAASCDYLLNSTFVK